MQQPYDRIFSLGYRCCSAGILKSLGLKTESYPFDWLVSRLPIIEHCIQTEFCEFTNTKNYKCVPGTTNNYTSIDPSSSQWICNESICYNEYYEVLNSYKPEFYLPKPLTPEKDAYGYKLMMNHRNILTNQADQEYFARCIERFNRPCKKQLALYIHPTFFYEEFLSIKPELIKELRRSYKHLFAMYPHDGIYIIPVKTPFEQPTNHCCKYVLEEQPDDILYPNCRICILWANRDFIDTGEIFMGNSYVETYVIKEYLQKTIQNNNLLENSANAPNL